MNCIQIDTCLQMLGTGSDRRRKNIITTGFSSTSLFENHRNRFRASFQVLADELEESLIWAIEEQVALIESDLEILRSDNVIEAHERNPQFRERLVGSVAGVQEEMGRIIARVDGVLGSV